MVRGTQLFEGVHLKISQAKQPPKLKIMAKKYIYEVKSDTITRFLGGTCGQKFMGGGTKTF